LLKTRSLVAKRPGRGSVVAFLQDLTCSKTSLSALGGGFISKPFVRLKKRKTRSIKMKKKYIADQKRKEGR